MSAKQSRLISKVLSPALGLWLRSQVQQVSDLLVKISGSDRQILSGYIPYVSISAHHAIYRGLHLTQIQLVAESIRINLAAVLRGQSLRLLEPVPVMSEMVLQELDLNASLQSSLLSNALTDLLSTTLLPANCPIDGPISWHQVSIDSGQLVLAATLKATGLEKPKPVVVRTGLQLASNHELQLEHPQIQMGELRRDLESLKLDLGPEVDLQTLHLSPGQIICHGRINVIP
ncbi:MAG: DUF2993 domain-containing protein [Chroococcidiopsidaceae cyanobacterium CP_BM_ER_R8_30]|nr:DUF2993 domain-containing protein [Chroococcidiopsidaceae cyanobacterium CP_BM_ER_R8_30]